MRDAGHQIVVDAGQVIDGLGNAVDQRQPFVGKDVALVELNAHHQYVGAAKVVLDAVVQMNIRVLLGKQVGEIGVDFQPRNAQGEK